MAFNGKIDILMITYNRPEYTDLALGRLLATCDESMRVWIWHNGEHQPTLNVVHRYLKHPAIQEFHHSGANERLNGPTNWFWRKSTAPYLAKVDDDCLVPFGWAQTLRKAHEDARELGVIGCWRFLESDFSYELARWKIKSYPGGHQIIQNLWIGGSGYVVKREALDQAGAIRRGESFTGYCLRLARKGWTNGWYLPLLVMDHMDDPRSSNTLLRCDDDLRRFSPLSLALYKGSETTLKEWEEGQRQRALQVQTSSIRLSDYSPLRLAIKRVSSKVRRLLE